MKTSIFIWGLAMLGLLRFPALQAAETSPNVQDFEVEFTLQNHPEEFLPSWSANEVRSTSSRVFQASGEGLDGSSALGIQTIGSFDAEIYIKTSTLGVENPKISFYAKTNQNGSGDRPVLLYFSFSDDEGETFGSKVQIGGEETFSNQDKAYQLFGLEIPAIYQEKADLVIKMEVLYGEGTGTSARLFIDDFLHPYQENYPQPLQIDAAILLSPYTLQFTTDQALETLHSDQVQLTDARSVSLDILDHQTFLLHSTAALVSHPLLLEIQGAKEASTGEITDLLSFELANDQVFCPQSFVDNPTTYLLRFTDLVDPATSLQTSLYSINGQAPEEISVSDNGYDVLLHLQRPLNLGEQVHVQVSPIKGISGKESQDFELNQTYEDHIEFIDVVEPQKIRVVHDVPLDQKITEELTFHIQDETFTLSPKVDEQDARVLWLDVAPELEENSTYLLELPSRMDHKKQPISGSVRTFSLDFLPPEITEVNVIEADQIMVTFSEAIDSVMAIIPGHYTVDGIAPSAVDWGNHPWQTMLYLSTSLEHQTTHHLLVSGITDLSGNVLQEGAISFTYLDPQALDFKSLIINEIMAAPKAENPLPYAEYVEIFNPGDVSIPLTGMRLANASRESGSIPPVELAPGEYLVLTAEGDQALFQKYGNTIGIGSWPRFVNNADEVKLLQKNGAVLDSLQYDAASYGSSALANGGYSLEVVNPFSPCNASLTLRPSMDPLLGTPGKENSVFDDTPDQAPPLLLEGNVSDTDALTLVFSEALNPDLSQVVWELDQSLEVRSVSFLPGSLTSVVLHFDQELREKTLYILTVHQLRDCSGNLMEAGKNRVSFQVPSLAEAGEVILNEVLYNPRSGMPKFVEIYNHSEKYIDLNQWKLANFANETISNRKLIATTPTLLPPWSYRAFTTDPSLLLQEYPKAKPENLIALSSLPSYPISGGTVLLLSPEEDLVERLDYSDKLHHELLQDSKGVSLERYSPKHPVDDPANWHSAAATEGYASPGYKNSQHYEQGGLEGGITLSPQVFDPDGIGPPNFTTISYHMPAPGHLGTMRVFAINGQLIKQICQNAMWGETGFYTWNGTNTQGVKVRPGYYIIWVEITNPDGTVQQFKKTVVIGMKF